MKRNDGSSRVPALDGWRGLAILLVIFDHANMGQGPGLLHRISRTGATGVGLFFALSGFLITTRLLTEYRSGRLKLWQFYVRRAFRLIPASLTYLLILCVLAGAGLIPLTGKEWAASLLFFRNYIPLDPGGRGWFTAHFWSLAVEEHFYLLWPALLIRTRAKAYTPAILACLIAIWRYVDLHYHVVQAQLWFQGRSDVRMDGLLWGCVLAILLCEASFRERVRRFYSWWLLVTFCTVDVGSNVLAGKHNYSPYEPLLIALILVWPVVHTQSWLTARLDFAPLRWIGALSYSLYVWQELWLSPTRVPFVLGKLQSLPLNLVCAFACAALSYYFIEKPMIRFGHRFTDGAIAKPALGALEGSAA